MALPGTTFCASHSARHSARKYGAMGEPRRVLDEASPPTPGRMQGEKGCHTASPYPVATDPMHPPSSACRPATPTGGTGGYGHCWKKRSAKIGWSLPRFRLPALWLRVRALRLDAYLDLARA